jgi:hypothetical protein
MLSLNHEHTSHRPVGDWEEGIKFHRSFILAQGFVKAPRMHPA